MRRRPRWMGSDCFLEYHNIAARQLCSLNVSLALPVRFHPSHGGTGRRRRRLLLSDGCFVHHWALITALTPFWRCRESDQRCLRFHSSKPSVYGGSQGSARLFFVTGSVRQSISTSPLRRRLATETGIALSLFPEPSGFLPGPSSSLGASTGELL